MFQNFKDTYIPVVILVVYTSCYATITNQVLTQVSLFYLNVSYFNVKVFKAFPP